MTLLAPSIESFDDQYTPSSPSDRISGMPPTGAANTGRSFARASMTVTLRFSIVAAWTYAR
jgi:hypothetical protein